MHERQAHCICMLDDEGQILLVPNRQCWKIDGRIGEIQTLIGPDAGWDTAGGRDLQFQIFLMNRYDVR